jgi:hypothetical protein
MCRTSRRATAPQMGFEGANVIFDTWVHPLMMGLEEHLITMFREDFEFNDSRAPSHLGPPRRSRARGRPPGRPTTARDCPRGRQRADGARPGTSEAERNCARSRSSSAARPAATQSASPRSGRGDITWRHSTMPKPTSAADCASSSSRWTATWPVLSAHAARQPRSRGSVLQRAAAEWEGAPRGPAATCTACTKPRMPHGEPATGTARSASAGALPRRHRQTLRRHHRRHHAVHGRPHQGRAAGAAGPPRSLRRDDRLHVRRRGHAPDAHGQVHMDGEAAERADGAAQAPARQARRTRPRTQCRRPADGDAAPLPKMLRFIPGTAQDVRAYFLTLQYWLAGSEQNIAHGAPCWSTATPTAARGAARHAQGGHAGGVPGRRRLHPRMKGAITSAREAAAPQGNTAAPSACW